MNKKIYTVQEAFEEMQSIHLGNLKSPVHREFINDTIIQAKKQAAITQNLARQLAALEAAFAEEMQASLIEETVQRLTQEIYDMANARSEAQTALKSGLRAMQGVADSQKVEAATVLFELMHKYDLHTGMNVDEQTAVIDSFILDVEENHAAQMAATGMEELYNSLKTWNQRVCDKVIERDEAKVGLGTERMKTARLNSDRAWRELRTAVNAYAYVQGDAGYAEFIGFMNVIIIRYKRVHLNEKVESPEDTGSGGSGSGEGSESTPSSPSTPNEPTNPGGSQEEQEYTVTYYGDNGEVITTQRYQVGQTIVPPTPPAGFEWGYLPNVMPARDLNVYPIDPETGA